MFRPLRDQILVKPIERRQSDTLIVINSEKYTRGLVVAVGPGERLHRRINEGETPFGTRIRKEELGGIRPLTVKPGDFVTLETVGAYPEYEENGVTYRIHQEKDVAFISDRGYIDQHNSLSDEQIDALLAAHRPIVAILRSDDKALAQACNEDSQRRAKAMHELAA